ncbi:MAG: hypothetical protein LQ343_000061 [Gyalolechia ehrenbergii]|nr:MAG: hypothetical protein LQ343_000061 [Gyalolechia ehrenbergii]
MTLRDLLKKREKIREDPGQKQPLEDESPPASQFTFVRSDTNTQEVISPPAFADDYEPQLTKDTQPRTKRFSRFRTSSNASTASNTSTRGEKRLSHRLHLGSHSRSSSMSSTNLPSDLPPISDEVGESEEKEAQWENRATILAQENPVAKQGRSRENSVPGSSGRPTVGRSISDAEGDENIQEAIRLHEAGDLENSTAMFGRLAESNAMAQIMYGLALRHGWGISPDPPLAITYLSQAASNSAAVESAALSSGMKKGGAAKGELVLAIYELANSFRHGWGVGKDPVAARSYYETAANLGDTDAMNEVARCYEEGFGGKKDRDMERQIHA